jgi:hypothetical protein
VKDFLIACAIAMGLSATGAMADGGPAPTPTPTQEEAPKKVTKKKKKKVHKTHKFHEDHKVAEVPQPPPSPEPPPPPTPEPVAVTPPPAPVVEEKKDDSGFYVGGGAGSFDLDVTGLNVNGIGGRARTQDDAFGYYVDVGYNFNRNIALEFRGGHVETIADTLNGAPLLGVPAGNLPFVLFADTDGFYSGFLKGTLPIGDDFGIYGLIGATHYVVDLAANIGPLVYREDFNDGDVSYGGGIEARIGDALTLGAEYVKYVDDSDGGVAVDLDGITGRVQFQF